MKKLRKEGRLKPFEKRGYYNSYELHDYENYFKSSNENAEHLATMRPDIVTTINERIRKEEEEKRRERSKWSEPCPGLTAAVAWMKKQKKQEGTDKNEYEKDEVSQGDEISKNHNSKKTTLKVSYQ